MANVFIDGSAGTTGLRIAQRLGSREDISIIRLPDALRKDINARVDAIHSADVSFLCLPDDAAKEIAAAAGEMGTIIDTSTAHRVDPDWVFGFPELPGQREKIASSRRIANPGCHASGFIALVAPLVHCGLMDPHTALSCFSLTGYSGGGKKMIAQYEDPNRDPLLNAPRQYGLTQAHKHLPEMVQICGLATEPAFCPIVADFYSGMEVTVSLFSDQLKGTVADIADCYRSLYTGSLVRYTDNPDPDGLLSAVALSGRDDMTVSVFGNDDRILLVSRFDNLGKGASGAAIQNMNILLGLPEETGLIV